MGLNIDQNHTTDSSVNVNLIHNTLNNFHNLLLLYDEFDRYLHKVDIYNCCRILFKCYSKLTEIVGSRFNENEFRIRYTSMAMNTFTTFTTSFNNASYLNVTIDQYFCTNNPTNCYLDSLISGSQNIREIYENVLKDVTGTDKCELASKIIWEFCKKYDICLRVLFCLSYYSFNMLGNYRGYSFTLRSHNNICTEIKLSDLVESYNTLGLFNYFMDLYENFCESYLEYTVPPSIMQEAVKMSNEFNINLHLKMHCADPGFYEFMKNQLLLSLQATNAKLKVLDEYVKQVFFIYKNFDGTKAIQPNDFKFDDVYIKEMYVRMVGCFFDDFCVKVSLMLPLVDALYIIERFVGMVHTTLDFKGLNYFQIYLEITLRYWENQVLNYVRTLSLNQYPVLAPVNIGGQICTPVVDPNVFLKQANFDTIIQCFTAYITHFLKTIGVQTSNEKLEPIQRLGFLKNTNNCYISINMYSLVNLMLKLLILPVELNHELTTFFESHTNILDKFSDIIKVTKNRILRMYIHKNSKLIQNTVILYLFNSNTSVNDFLLTINKLSMEDHGFHQIITVFLIYISNAHCMNSMATMVPHLIQCSQLVYSGLSDSEAESRILIGLIKNNYKLGLVKISLLKLQDHLIAHLSAFNQQFVQRVVSNTLNMLRHTSSESNGNDLTTYLLAFSQLLFTHLPHETYINILTICIDLTYNCVIFEVLDFFERINYKFNQQLFNKIKVYVESLSYSINQNVTNGLELDLSYAEKFANFLKVFNDYNGVSDHLYGYNESSRLNKLIRHIKTF
ncbi:conserved hypothetical protein [Theileria orientalis strain Shintoku]|uniref:Uncharacterized protein n=1 Tax=Theileria orientalis strain Shintoku TaxID=869250 RepID=J4DPK3_THEOR|nr:conserved hypothetical protein [Theileria orientalis strain Shintoku]BAM40854.1 conserved hypothetical protein [Theileria orientalis strain Shintoku]|eukprot:XP_009691155.1 conserved hypothetical protein [Theileria orientalis strain Shintoku]